MVLKGKIKLFEDKSIKLPGTLYGEFGVNPCAEMVLGGPYFAQYAKAVFDVSHTVDHALSKEELNLIVRALNYSPVSMSSKPLSGYEDLDNTLRDGDR